MFAFSETKCSKMTPRRRPRRAKIAPRRLQDLPKTIFKRFFLQLLFRLRFWSVLAPTWAPFAPPMATQNHPQIEPKNVRKSRCRKMASKIARDSPTWPKIAHNIPPRGFNIAPRLLQVATEPPRDTPEMPKTFQNEGQNLAKSDLGRSLGSLSEPLGCLLGSSWAHLGQN